MIDPCKLVDCPTCNGTGEVGQKCPYPPDMDPECRECGIQCNLHGSCCDCDGTGQVEPRDAGYIRKMMEV